MLFDFTVIEGNIGSGKTTLVQKLAEEHNTYTIFEEFEENPFLDDFLENQNNNPLGVELQFLIDRYHQLKKANAEDKKIVSDYFIEKSLIFAKSNLNLHEQKLFDNYFEALFNTIQKPNLLVYLSVNSKRLQENIKLRGRENEVHLTNTYLEKIHSSYMNYFEEKEDTKIVVIETSAIDFVKDEYQYEKIKKIINKDHEIGISYYTM